MGASKKKKFLVEVAEEIEENGILTLSPNGRAVVCLMQFVDWWPFLAEGERIQISNMVIVKTRQYANKMILVSTENTRVVGGIQHQTTPLQGNQIRDQPEQEENVKKKARLSKLANVLGKGKDIPIVSYQGIVSARAERLIEIDQIATLHVVDDIAVFANKAIRVGAFIEITSVLMLTGIHQSLELLPTARTSVKVLQHGNLLHKSFNQRSLTFQGSRVVKSTKRGMLSNFILNKLTAKFQKWLPKISGYTTSSTCRCEMHAFLYGSEGHKGLVCVLEDLICNHMPNRGETLAYDIFKEFIHPNNVLQGMGGVRIPTLLDLERTSLQLLDKTSPKRSRYWVWKAGIFSKVEEKLPSLILGSDVCHVTEDDSHDTDTYVLGILKPTSSVSCMLVLEDETNQLIVRWTRPFPAEFIGSLVCLKICHVVLDAKEQVASLLIQPKHVKVLVNGPNLAASRSLASCTKADGLPSSSVSDFRLSRCFSSIERCDMHKTDSDSSNLVHIFVFTTSIAAQHETIHIAGKLVGFHQEVTDEWMLADSFSNWQDIEIRVEESMSIHFRSMLETQLLYVFRCNERNIPSLKHVLYSAERGSVAGKKHVMVHCTDLFAATPGDIQKPFFRKSNACGILQKLCWRNRGTTLFSQFQEWVCNLKQHLDRSIGQPLWRAFEYAPDHAPEIVNISGVVKHCAYNHASLDRKGKLLLLDATLGLIEADISFRDPYILYGLISGLHVVVDQVRRHVSETGIISFQATENSRISTRTSSAKTSSLCFSNSSARQRDAATFPLLSLNEWSKPKGSSLVPKCSAAVRVRPRKLLQLQFAKYGESNLKNEVNISAKVLADDGTCQVILHTSSLKDTLRLLGDDLIVEETFEGIILAGYSGTITKEAAFSAATKPSAVQQAWKMLHLLFQRESFRPSTVLLQRTRFPELVDSDSPCNRKEFKFFEFNNAGVWTAMPKYIIMQANVVKFQKDCNIFHCPEASFLEQSLDFLEFS